MVKSLTGFDTIVDELNSHTTQLAQKAQQISILNGLTVSLASYPRNSGEIDDTGSFTRALQAVSLGASLEIPNGSYTISSFISTTIPSNTSVQIKGKGTVIINSTCAEPGTETALFLFNGSAASSIISMENITINHNNTNATGLIDGLYFNHFQKVFLTNITVTKCSWWGGHIYDVHGGVISGCQFDNNRYGGLGIESSSNLVVTGGSYSSNGTNPPNDGYGISLKTQSSGAGWDNKNILIQGVYASNNCRKGIDIHNGLQIVVRGNFSIGNANGQIYAVNEGWSAGTYKNVKDVIIEGNYVDGTTTTFGSQLYFGINVGSYGTTATDAGTAIVKGNIIKNVNYCAVLAINATVPSAWSATTAYTTSNTVTANGNIYQCTTAGTSGSTAPSGTGTSITDGTVVWTYISAISAQPTLRKLIVEGNDIEYGSGSGYVPIYGGSSGVNLGDVVISNNIVHTVTCPYGIEIQQVNNINVNNNIITVDSGTVNSGIYAPGTASEIFVGNQLLGGATYSTPISASGNWNSLSQSNLSAGKPTRNYMGAGMTDEFSSTIAINFYYRQGSRIWLPAPSAGGSMGWVCTIAGYYNASPWAASTPYSVGNQVNANGKVYQCTVAGTSGSTAPSFSSGTGTDGTVTWSYIGTLGVFKTFGSIQS